MEVKIYREPENQELILDEAKLEEYNKLISELGISNPKDEKKTPNVYQYLNNAMAKQLNTLCPMHIAVENYTKSTIPLDVLKVLQYCKDQEMFDGYSIWWDDKAPDPVLVGWNWSSEEDKEKNYYWRVDKYLIARWGDCSMEIPELMEKGFQRIRQQLLDKTNLAMEKCKAVLRNPDLYVRDILEDGHESKIDLNIPSAGTVYRQAMYIQAQLVVKSYIPVTLEKGDWFVRKHYKGTVREYSEIFELFKVPQDKDEFITRNGYPVEVLVVQEYLDGSKPAILARSREIGWWDEPEEDEYVTITLEHINMIIQEHNSFISIDVDGETGEPTLLSNQVVLSYPDNSEYIEDDDNICYNCGSDNLVYNSSGEYTCINCGYEENEQII